jgi:hypothetical protein
MRGSAWLALCLVGGCATAGTRAGDAGTDPQAAEATVAAAQELRGMQDQWRRALSARDTAFFRRVLAEEFLLTGDARTQTKTDFLLELASSGGTVPSAHPEETNVRLFGNIAVITGLVRYDIPASPTPVQVRYTEVWVKRDGQWFSVHGHYNLLSSVKRPGE